MEGGASLAYGAESAAAAEDGEVGMMAGEDKGFDKWDRLRVFVEQGIAVFVADTGMRWGEWDEAGFDEDVFDLFGC